MANKKLLESFTTAARGLRNELDDKIEESKIKYQQNVEKQNIARKQIRALRNRYRAGGLLGASPRGVDVSPVTGLSEKLG